MAASNQRLAAVHFFYLLKEDRESIEQLWSLFSEGAPAPDRRPDDLELGQQQTSSGYCHLVQRVSGPQADLCLLTMADLAVVQLLYRADPALTPDRNREQAKQLLERDRDRVPPNLDIFGETTLLLSTEPADGGLTARAMAMFGSATAIEGSLRGDLAGGEAPQLIALPAEPAGHRDFFALASPAAEEIISGFFPLMDSLIKRLRRYSAYFREQRRAIVREREEVDCEIGALLHRQVMTRSTGELRDSPELERQIDSLSQMFGMLATDSLLVRQAGDRLEEEIGQLKNIFTDQLAPGGQLADFYLEPFLAELESARGETRNLDFSRQNALAAIEVVRTQVSLLRASEEAGLQQQTSELLSRSLVLQKERLSLQVATGFIEFVVLFYYIFHVWEGVAGAETVEHLAPIWRLVLIGGMSAGASLLTHFLAQFLQNRSWRNRGLWVSATMVVFAFAGMVILSL